MEIPEELYYTHDHEWLRLDGPTAVVGITAFAVRELGDLVYIDIPVLDSQLEAGEVFGTIEAVKTVSDLFMPIAGKIIAVNQAAIVSPELLGSDPYGDAGWLIKVDMTGVAAAGSLLNDEQYRELIGE